MRKIYGYACFGGFAVLSALLAVSLRLGLPADLPFVSVLLFAAGFLVAGMFAYASRLGADDQRQLVSPLYAADLLGGCVACVAGSMFLVPFVGMDASAVAVAVLSLVALAVV